MNEIEQRPCSRDFFDKQPPENRPVTFVNGGALQSVSRVGKEQARPIGLPKPSKPPVLPSMTEQELATCFDDLATVRSWTWCGFRPARQRIGGEEVYRTPVMGQKGLPDRVLARDGVVLVVEFKTDAGRLSEGQVIWGKALAKFEGYHILRPKDWYSGKIDDILK